MLRSFKSLHLWTIWHPTLNYQVIVAIESSGQIFAARRMFSLHFTPSPGPRFEPCNCPRMRLTSADSRSAITSMWVYPSVFRRRIGFGRSLPYSKFRHQIMPGLPLAGRQKLWSQSFRPMKELFAKLDFGLGPDHQLSKLARVPNLKIARIPFP
jgi:hypothetical protein